MIDVVTVEEMKRAERTAGVKETVLMDLAAAGIVLHIEKMGIGKGDICIVAGRGNNGADGCAAAVLLLQKGYNVYVVQIFPDERCAPLFLLHKQRFVQQGGRVEPCIRKEAPALIVDGLLGIGCKGALDAVLEAAVHAINASPAPVVSIDIPSGLFGTTGEAFGPCVRAHHTIAMGFPKLGCFIGKGWEHVGSLSCVDLGLSAHPIARLVEKTDAFLQMPEVHRTRHKYEAGYVVACAGSIGMEGAAFLSSVAALRSGSGIVRLFHEEGMNSAQAPWELIKEPFDLKRFKEEIQRASACFIGPGFGRSKERGRLIKKILALLSIPSVLDADALYFLAKHPRWKIPAGAILTPHKAEMQRLLGCAPTIDGCSTFAEKKKITVILKGAPTFIFHPKQIPYIVTEGSPGMATAGSGDVLTGIVAALLAQKMPPLEAALLGVFLHSFSGMRAEKRVGPYSLIASDLIQELPSACMEQSVRGRMSNSPLA